MSEQKRADDTRTSSDEAFLQRWSRRKADVKAGVDVEPDPQKPEAEPTPLPETQPQTPVAVELPDLGSLDADSDYSAFMSPGVDSGLQRKALRKLFSSPKFNVCDGLDDYCGDYTKFEGLGDIVTADMKHHIERLAREAAKALEEAGQENPAPALAASTAAAADAAPAETPTEQQKEEHDGPERPA
jgi:hypothetical protein